jgi:hypothetical protein
MQPVVWTALLIGSALASGKKFDTYLPVPIVKTDRDVVFAHGLEQLKGDLRNVVATTPAAVTSIGDGLPHVRKVADYPILAATEAQGYYLYATVVVPDEKGQPRGFISGYAIKKGGREIISWSVW